MTEPVPKRADQLVVGDRILPYRLPSTYALGPGEVVYVKPHVYRGNSSVFVAYVHKDGYYDSTSYLPDGTVEVLPASPVGFDYSRADEQPGPVAGRIPPHFEDGRAVVEVGGGLIEIDPPEGFVAASAPYATFAEQREAYEREEAMRLPRCPNCRGRHHADEPCS